MTTLEESDTLLVPQSSPLANIKLWNPIKPIGDRPKENLLRKPLNCSMFLSNFCFQRVN